MSDTSSTKYWYQANPFDAEQTIWIVRRSKTGNFNSDTDYDEARVEVPAYSDSNTVIQKAIAQGSWS
jgi:hypothetical protein